MWKVSYFYENVHDLAIVLEATPLYYNYTCSTACQYLILT